MTSQTKNYRKFIATAATASLVATAVVPAASANVSKTETDFTDVGGQYITSVDYLYHKGIIQGLSDTQFGTSEDIKRVDVAVMIANALLTKEEIDNAAASGFTDVPARAAKHVDALKEKGFVNGKSETNFAAHDSITRGEVALMLKAAYGIEGDVDNVTFTDVAPRYKEAVAALVDNDITQGKKGNRFGTDDAITRGELAIFLYKMETLEEEVEEFSVQTVEAIDTTVDATTEGQFLIFTVNGENITLEKLAEEGYEVEFRSTVTNIFKDSATGELDEEKLTADTSFEYNVVLTKDEEVIQSELATVTVEEFTNVIVSLDEYTLKTDGKVLTNNILTRNETGLITDVLGTSKAGGEVKFGSDKLTFESSNTNVLFVNEEGKITPVATGDAKVTVKIKETDVAIEIPVTIAAEDRKADQVTASVEKIGLVTEGTFEFFLTVKDQYGEAFASYDVADIEIQDEEEIIANVAVATEDEAEGLYKATVTATENAGKGTLEIELDEKTALSLDIAVSDDKTVHSRKLELVNSTNDQTLDLNPLEKDGEVDFVFNQYNKEGIFIKKETAIGTDSGQFKVSANNENVSVAVKNGVITVTGEKAGSSVITVKEGDIERGKVSVTVENTTPTIKTVTFPSNKIEESPAALKNIFDTDGVELTSSGDVSIDFAKGEAILFVNIIDGTTAGKYDEGDILLGKVKVVSGDIENLSISEEGQIVIGQDHLTVEANGKKLALTVTADGKDIAVNTVTVDIKENKDIEVK